MYVSFRRVIGALALVAALVLGRAPLAAAAAPAAPDAASVVVYPFVSSQDTSADAAARITTGITSQLGALGEIAVKPVPSGTPQHAYLDAARKAGADYYLTGYVTRLSDLLSVVEQLVSTRTGSIVWSSTSQLALDSDAQSDGKIIHDVIVQYADRGFAAVGVTAPPAGPAPSVRSGANGPSVQLGGGPAAAKAAPSAPAAAGPPPVATTATVLAFDGPAPQSVRDFVPYQIIRTFKQYGVDASISNKLTLKDVETMGPAVCAETGATYLVGGSVNLEQVDLEIGSDNWQDARITMIGYDCANLKAKPRTITERAETADPQTAVDIAITDALKKFLGK